VPGNASGGMDGIALKPLTVSFSEPGFVSKLNQENQFGPWFTLSDKERQQLGSLMGPQNPQALNRYSYVLNNPIRNTDPSGHLGVTVHDDASVTIHLSEDDISTPSNYAGEAANVQGRPDAQAILTVLGAVGNTIGLVDFAYGGQGLDVTIMANSQVRITQGTITRQHGLFLDPGVKNGLGDLGVTLWKATNPSPPQSVTSGSCGWMYSAYLVPDRSKVYGPPLPTK